MVDFQSRESRSSRLSGDDEGDESADTPDEEAGESDAEPDPPSTDEEPTPTEVDRSVGVAILVAGDDADAAADAVVDPIGEHHEIVGRDKRTDDLDAVQRAVDVLVDRPEIDAIVTVGGTGVGRDDVVVEAVHPLFRKSLPGFGEAFRTRYADTAGSDVVAMRATAGVAEDTPVFCLPGEADAAVVAAREFVVPTVGDLVADAAN